MSLNWKEIDLILAELELEGCFLQQIYQPVHQVILFDLHKPGKSFSLFFCLSPGACRLHEFTGKLKNPKRPQRFASFLRARVRGSRIISAGQLQGERIIKILVRKGGVESVIWTRLWSGAANMIVTDTGGRVLDACYRRKKRNEISGGYYNPEQEMAALVQQDRKKAGHMPRQLPGEGSFNSRIAAFYIQQEETKKKDQLFQKALHQLDAQISYYQTTLTNFEQTRKRDANYTRYKEIGDLIMASLTRIQPGSRWLTVPDFYHDNQEVEIELNNELTPPANAEVYYQKYRSARKNMQRISDQAARCRSILEKLEGDRKHILEDHNPRLIMEYVSAKQQKKLQDEKKKIPGLQFYSAGFGIYVGRNAAENDSLLRYHVRGNDYWFHTRDYTGAYVFIKSIPGKSVPLDVLLDAGNLAVSYSRAKNSGKADVYYTRVKYLRRTRHGKTGLVIPTREKNLVIVLDEERLEKLKKN